MTQGAPAPDPASPDSAYPDVPVARRTYFPPPDPIPSELRPCPACGQRALSPWYLHRDRDRCVWRRWVCLACQRYQDLPEDESA